MNTMYCAPAGSFFVKAVREQFSKNYLQYFINEARPR